MDISALTVDRGTPRSTFVASVRASTAPARAAQQAPGANTDDTGPSESIGLTLLRKNLEAAQLALARAIERNAGEDAVQTARARVMAASQALADAQVEQAREAAQSLRASRSVDTYA